MSREYCIKCNECLTLEDNLCSVAGLDDLENLIKNLYVMSISWCTHVGDIENLLRNLCCEFTYKNYFHEYHIYYDNLKLTVTNHNYKKKYKYDYFAFHVNYIINNQETLKEIANLLSSTNENNELKIIDVNTNNKIEFSFENLNNYIGRPFKISTEIGSIHDFDVQVLTKNRNFSSETVICVDEIIGLCEYDSIPDESIIYIFHKRVVNKLLLILSKTHELQVIPQTCAYSVRKLHTKTKPALH